MGVAAIAAIGAAGAAGGAATGALAAMVPSICSMLTSPNDWAVVHPRVKIEGKKALIEDSKIPCTLGGNVLILYSLEAAEDFTDLKALQTVADVGGIILGSALVSVSIGTVMTGSAAFFGSVKMINSTFGAAAAWKFAGEGAAWLIVGYGASKGVDAAKKWAYEQLGIGDYAEGKFEQRADELTQSPGDAIDHYDTAGNADNFGDAASILRSDDPNDPTHRPRVSQYEELEYERRTGLHTNDGSVREEYESDRVSNRNPNSTRELNPNRTSVTDIDHQTDRSGAYYNRETHTLETGRQLDAPTTSDRVNMGKQVGKNAFPSPLEWGIDAWRIFTNYMLEDSIKDLENSMQAEAAARASVKVIEKEI